MEQTVNVRNVTKSMFHVTDIAGNTASPADLTTAGVVEFGADRGRYSEAFVSAFVPNWCVKSSCV